MISLSHIIRNSALVVHSGRYAYLKVRNPPLIDEHFLISKDAEEITVVTRESNIRKIKAEKTVKWFKLLEVRTIAPFASKGLNAKVTSAIAAAGSIVLCISTFSKDYFLVPEENLTHAVNALKKVGFKTKHK